MEMTEGQNDAAAERNLNIGPNFVVSVSQGDPNHFKASFAGAGIDCGGGGNGQRSELTVLLLKMSYHYRAIGRVQTPQNTFFFFFFLG